MNESVVLSIQVGTPTMMGIEEASNPMHRRWTSGIVKKPLIGSYHDCTAARNWLLRSDYFPGMFSKPRVK
jgi:hypothetical protein